MKRSSLETTAVAFVSAVGLVAAGQTAVATAAIRPGTTANTDLDGICQQLAALVNEAHTEGDPA